MNPETNRIKYKQNLTDNLEKEAITFLNYHEGGVIYIGIDKKGKPIGVSDIDGAIEQDADVVLFLYRDEVYNPDTENPGMCEVNVAKHRNGPTGVVEVSWLAKYTKFANIYHGEN